MSRRRDDNWIDGLRGVASFIVVTGHICTAFAPHLHSPALSENGPSTLFQYPLFRLCVGGRSAVSIFFIITGYVNAINPLRNMRDGAIETALTNLSKSAFMRTGRLMLPTAAIIFIGWLMFELGLFRMAKITDSIWISYWLRNPEPTAGKALWRLLRAEIEYWVTGEPPYNATLWSIPFFLHGSMMVYLTLLATAFVTSTARRIVIVGLYMFGWCGGQPIEHTNIFFGLLLADLSTSLRASPVSTPTLVPSSPSLSPIDILKGPAPRTRTPLLRRIVGVLPALLILLGLVGCSYPEKDSAWTGWSYFMDQALTRFAPWGIDLNRYWVSVGACTLFTGLHYSPTAQRLLSSPLFNFLGRCSFPVYLMHDLLMRTVLVWMIYGGSHVVVDVDGNVQPLRPGGTGTFIVAIPAFYCCLYAIAWLWLQHMEPIFAKCVAWMKRTAWRDDPELPSVRTLAWSEKIPSSTVSHRLA